LNFHTKGWQFEIYLCAASVSQLIDYQQYYAQLYQGSGVLGSGRRLVSAPPMSRIPWAPGWDSSNQAKDQFPS